MKIPPPNRRAVEYTVAWGSDKSAQLGKPKALGGYTNQMFGYRTFWSLHRFGKSTVYCGGIRNGPFKK